jgi:phosphoribosylamine--glycine ligase
MKILIVGGGGREHALAWKCAQSPRVAHVFVAPGNAGTALEPNISNVDIAADDSDALVKFAEKEGIDLTVIGPEGPLVAGIVDRGTAAPGPGVGPPRAIGFRRRAMQRSPPPISTRTMCAPSGCRWW